MRYKASEIEDRIYSGMSEETEFVLASDYDALSAELEAVKGTDHYQRSLDEMHLRYNVEAELDALAAELARVKAENRAIANRFGDGLKRANSFNPNEPLGKVIDRCVMALVNLDDIKKEHALVRDINCFLNDELATVKAESLRVVKVGDPCEISKISICACFLHLGALYRQTP